jgi:hypothetical protein
MRTYEIKRRESGRFYLFSLYGNGRCLHEQEWDLSVDVSESKVMLQAIIDKTRPEELPEEDREPLINSVSELIPIPKKGNGIVTNNNPQTGRIQLPSENNYPPFTINFPGAI